MRSPRLLIITTIPVTLRAFLVPFATHFRQLGWRVDAAATGVSKCAACGAAFDCVHDLPVSRNPLQPANLLLATRQIRRLVRENEYDLVHTHTPVASFVTRLALRRIRCSGRPKVIYTAHGFHFHPGGTWLKNTLFACLERLAGRWTDYLIVINRDDEQAARRRRLVPPDRITYMPGIGVDREFYAPDCVSTEEVSRARAELALEASDVLFLMIGYFDPGKRHRDALRAFASLPPQAHLAFAGDGPLRQELEKLAAAPCPAPSTIAPHASTVASRIHFLGVRSDIRALIRAARATLLPSEREGLPRSIMESLCLEVPVIATNIRGSRDLVGTECGLRVPVGDPVALGKAMQCLLDHPEQAAAMGKCGRAKMAAFDVRHVLKLHEELYRVALRHPDASAA